MTAHLAQSLDGRLGVEGRTTRLSTAEGEHAAHVARADHDAVLVGVRTVRVDDPQLTVRLVDRPSPLRVILASSLDVPANARALVRSRPPGVLVIGAHGVATDAARRALEAAGADVAIADATAEGMVSIDGALAILADRGVKTLLVEGGARVLTSFIQARQVHRVEIEIAMSTLGSTGTLAIAAPLSLANVVVDRLGANVLVRGDVVARS